MTTPTLTATLLNPRTDAPTIILGHSLGTSAASLWTPIVPALSDDFQLIGVDFPGHGKSAGTREPFTIGETAEAVASLVRSLRTDGTIAWGSPVYYAGVSIGGAVGLQLGLDAPDLFSGIAIICSAAKLGESAAWLERADLVESAGTPTQVIGSAQRWFAPGFLEDNKTVATSLLHALQETDRFAYAECCRALADFDVRERLAGIQTPVLAIAGEVDPVFPPAEAEAIAIGVARGRFEVVPGAAHQAPAEKPEAVADLLVDAWAAPRAAGSAAWPDDVFDAGMEVRREVLGDAHVDRANDNIVPFTADFQAYITRAAWGSVWTRPGLPRTTRSAITITAMIAGGYWDELAMHVAAALRNGLTPDEIKEIILQSAVYCSIPAANHAFGIARRVLEEAGAI